MTAAIDRLIVIIIFIFIAMHKVGRGTGPRSLLVKTTTRTAKTLFGEDRDKEEFDCPWVADGRRSKNQITAILAATSPYVEDLTRMIAVTSRGIMTSSLPSRQPRDDWKR